MAKPTPGKVEGELEEAERRSQQADVISLWSATDVQRLLGTLRHSLEADREQGHMRDAISGLNL